MPADIKDIVCASLARHESRTGRVLGVLVDVQAALGYIPPEALDCLAGYEGISRTQLERFCGVFKGLSLQPVGRHVISVCDGTACHARGARDVAKAICDVLGLSDATADVTPDMALGELGAFATEADCPALENRRLACGPIITADGEFTVRYVHCVGACAKAPLVVADGQVAGNLRISDAAKIPTALRAVQNGR